MPISPDQALRRLQEGNARFQEDPRAENWTFTGPDLSELAEGQRPFAAVLGCADSRVPVEVVFGQGPGQLFVVRVAGNVAASTQVGSLEFAVAALGVRLLVVLGHSGCGAVTAALEPPASELPPDLRDLTRRIAGHLPDGLGADRERGLDQRVAEAVEANVRAGLGELAARSALLRSRAAAGELLMTGAVYHLADGRVEWLEG